MRSDMRSFKIFTLLFTICLLTISVSAQKKRVKSWTCPPMTGNVLNREVCEPNFDWENTDITTTLMTSFSSTETPAGISEIFTKSEEKRQTYNLTPNSLLLTDVLTKIITVEPRYQWKEEKGVINVFPIDDYEILDTRIPKFKFENKTKGELLDEIEKTKQFKKYLKKNKVTFPTETMIVGLIGSQPPRVFSIDMQNATVREILNEIVRLNGSSTWFYREYEMSYFGREPRRYYSLYFIVRTD